MAAGGRCAALPGTHFFNKPSSRTAHPESQREGGLDRDPLQWGKPRPGGVRGAWKTGCELLLLWVLPSWVVVASMSDRTKGSGQAQV